MIIILLLKFLHPVLIFQSPAIMAMYCAALMVPMFGKYPPVSNYVLQCSLITTPIAPYSYSPLMPIACSSIPLRRNPSPFSLNTSLQVGEISCASLTYSFSVQFYLIPPLFILFLSYQFSLNDLHYGWQPCSCSLAYLNSGCFNNILNN